MEKYISQSIFNQFMVTIEDKFTAKGDIDVWYQDSLDGINKAIGTYHARYDPIKGGWPWGKLGFLTTALRLVYETLYDEIVGEKVKGKKHLETLVQSWDESKFESSEEITKWYNSVTDGLSKGIATAIDKYGFVAPFQGEGYYEMAIRSLTEVMAELDLMLDKKRQPLLTFEQVFYKYVHAEPVSSNP